LEIERKLGNQPEIAATIRMLGRLSEAESDLGVAERYYQEALNIFEKLQAKSYLELARKDLERVKAKRTSSSTRETNQSNQNTPKA
jgi:hypothetical protein